MVSILAIGFWCLVIASVVALTVVKTRASRQRKEMLAELTSAGSDSDPRPTDLAFLEAGAPPPDPPAHINDGEPDAPDTAGGTDVEQPVDRAIETAPSAGSDPSTDEALDRLARVFSGVCLPCELTPLTMSSALRPDHATFVTVGHTTDEIRQNLEQQFRECGLEEIWHDDLRATLRREGSAALVTIHPFPGQAHDEDERPRFPTAPEESVVVEFTAL
ncbi:MAG: hypothetical protein DCC48_10195 [Acidobacteria bacterium]|nr:MAG: hypothetical protein DCC48_10195 [Acidobacteriota bacterium]